MLISVSVRVSGSYEVWHVKWVVLGWLGRRERAVEIFIKDSDVVFGLSTGGISTSTINP